MPANLPRSDELELDLKRYELRRSGRVLRIEKIPMELFIFLVENRYKLVSREAIVDRLWGKDVFLDTEQGINTAVRKIRQALHDDPEQPRFLETVVAKAIASLGPSRLWAMELTVALPQANLSLPSLSGMQQRTSLEAQRGGNRNRSSSPVIALVSAVLALKYFD